MTTSPTVGVEINQSQTAESPRLAKAILAAALAIPGITLSSSASAATPPERGALTIKRLNYQDSQPGWDRIHVDTTLFGATIPIDDDWSMTGGLALDTVSGASPTYHSQRRGSGKMEEFRRAEDISVTRYFPLASVTLGFSHSGEGDYWSNALSLRLSLSSDDKNTTYDIGVGGNKDTINVPIAGVNYETKRGMDVLVGITQVMSQTDIVQVNLSHLRGQGFYTDPYKFFDNRPRKKDQSTLVVKWNHHVKAWGTTERFSYRYYTDSFGIRAHTLGLEHVHPLLDGWTLTPALRLHSQSAADFFVGVVNPPFPTIPAGFIPGTTIISQDQRLSAFGARTFGLKAAKELGPDWSVDARYEHYEQRGSWRIGGAGSSGMEPFRARSVIVGVTRLF
jgi:Protein of unknown function (DUF3570)